MTDQTAPPTIPVCLTCPDYGGCLGVYAHVKDIGTAYRQLCNAVPMQWLTFRAQEPTEPAWFCPRLLPLEPAP